MPTAVYGASLVALFAASSAYHLFVLGGSALHYAAITVLS